MKFLKAVTCIMKKRTILILITLAVILGGIFFYSFYWTKRDSGPAGPDGPPDNKAKDRFQMMQEVEKKIGELSPVEPTTESDWKIKRFAFVDDENFFVQYEGQDKLRRILVKFSKKDGYQLKAFFKPGENLWKLIEGENPYLGASVDVYEKTEEGKWVKIN